MNLPVYRWITFTNQKKKRMILEDILWQNINVTIKKLLNLLFSFCFPNVVISKSKFAYSRSFRRLSKQAPSFCSRWCKSIRLRYENAIVLVKFELYPNEAVCLLAEAVRAKGVHLNSFDGKLYYSYMVKNIFLFYLCMVDVERPLAFLYVYF